MLGQFFGDSDNSATANFDLIQPSDIAAAVIYLLDSEKATQLSGVELHVGTGIP